MAFWPSQCPLRLSCPYEMREGETGAWKVLAVGLLGEGMAIEGFTELLVGVGPDVGCVRSSGRRLASFGGEDDGKTDALEAEGGLDRAARAFVGEAGRDACSWRCCLGDAGLSDKRTGAFVGETGRGCLLSSGFGDAMLLKSKLKRPSSVSTAFRSCSRLSHQLCRSPLSL